MVEDGDWALRPAHGQVHHLMLGEPTFDDSHEARRSMAIPQGIAHVNF
jgi:hypothetical protein